MAAVAVALPSEHGFSQPTSSAGLLAMLDEDEAMLQVHALKQLNRIVDEFWAEISAEISKLEALYEDEAFEERELAALLASKVFYHLGELDESLTYALGAGRLFDVAEESEYVQTLVAKCIDQYVELSVKANESREKQPPLDPRLVAIVERMLNKCISDGQYQQAVGIALECRRLDKLEEAITQSDDVPALLAYTLRVSQTLVNRREFRHEVLRTLVKLYTHSGSPDYINICQCLMFLDDPAGVASILDKLVKGDTDDALLAYQVAFDLFENEFQQFLLNVRDRLPDPRGHAEAGPAPTGGSQAAPAEGGSQATPAEGGGSEAAPPAAEATPPEVPAAPKDEASPMEEDAGAREPPPPAIEGLGDLPIATYVERMTRLKGVLSGETPINLALQFLYSRNRADLLILKNIKAAVDARNSVCHGAIIYSNGLMHAGTTVDTFLRENLEWLSRSTNWAKFSATAGLGVIHRGHLQQGRALMAPYLPQNGVSGSPYSEGGALYALGLIHANHGESIKTFLLESLRNTSNEIIQHGAALGLGLAALGTANDEIFEDLKSVLFTDSANAGEGAGIGMGLLMAGSASEKAGEMLAYAHETQHEKIIRSLALGIALVVYGREEEADTLIEQMTRDQDPILRYGGMYALAMAYRATANNSAIRRLLHFAVSDVSDDVRRTAVLSLGFVLCSEPEQCPRIVALLAESYNPHVRYGAAMAVGIACAGTGLAAALDLLEPLQKDSTDFVRQGALIATAMVLIQETEARQPKVAAFRKHLDKVIADKHEETMGKMGAILAAGILDAGGRNVTISLRSRSGHDRVTAIVGMAVFTQWWYWYPLVYFLSLTFAPTALIGLNANLQMPRLEVSSAARPSLFAYPAPLSDKKEEEVKKVPTAQLSTTARAKTKAKKDAAEKAEKGKEAIEKVVAKGGKKEEENDGGDAMEVDKEKEPEVKKAKKEKEPESELLSNPARVVPPQEKFVKFVKGSRYVPLKKVAAGWVLLKDLKPNEPEELVSQSAPAEQGAAAAPAAAPAAAGGPAQAADEEEPPPPEPFEYRPS